MATATNNATFESLKEDIIRLFEQLHQKLDERKNVLIGQLIATKEGLEQTAEMTEISEKRKSKRLASLPESKRKRIDQNKDEEARKLTEKFNMVKLHCDTTKLEECIAQISLVEGIPAYASKLAPVINCGAKGSGHVEFNEPRYVCIDATDNVYVVDCGNNRIQVLNKAGEYVSAFGTPNLKEAYAVAVTEQFVYVTDPVLHCIVWFSRDGTFIKSAGSHGSLAPLAFNRPRGIAAYNGMLYVCDYNNRIQVVDTFLNYIEEFTSNELSRPHDIHITADTIHVLPGTGNIVHLFANPGYAPLRVVKLTGQKYDMNRHLFFTVDQLGNYLISARQEHQIRVFDNTGVLRHIIGEGHMQHPRGIAVDSNNNIICVNDGVNKFQVY